MAQFPSFAAENYWLISSQSGWTVGVLGAGRRDPQGTLTTGAHILRRRKMQRACAVQPCETLLSRGAVPVRPAVPRGVKSAPQRKHVYNQPFLLTGGPQAPALCGVDRRHRENLLQKSAPRGKEGEGFPVDSQWGLFPPPKGAPSQGPPRSLKKVLLVQGRKETRGQRPSALSACLYLKGSSV